MEGRRDEDMEGRRFIGDRRMEGQRDGGMERQSDGEVEVQRALSLEASVLHCQHV